MNPLIFWAQRTVVFPKKPNRKIFLHIILKERLLHFNTIIFRELMV